MLAHVSAEELGFFDHTMADAGSIEQMKTVGMPDGNADMTGVETSSGSEDNDDVAVVDGLTQEFVIGELALGNIREPFARDAFLHRGNLRNPVGMFHQHGVETGVCSHVVGAYRLCGGERRIMAVYAGDEIFPAVFLYP